MSSPQGPSSLVLTTVLTCPNCGHTKEETMRTDACQFFYACENCHTRLKPLTGDCCVFCSYGSVPCPPVQAAEESGAAPCCST
ncbi:MAG: hypothetical protein D6722_04335 [Bacteroidetes bacterium]|nr:MAG: hypothetical protein D6722_04335 [Bacteroidota bacterium]